MMIFFFLMVFLCLWNLNFPNLSSSIRTKRCAFFSPNYKYIPKSSHFTRSLKSLVLGFTLYLTLMPQNKQKSYFKIFESPCSMPFRSSAWLESAFFLFCKSNYTFISPRNEAPLYTNAKSQTNVLHVELRQQQPTKPRSLKPHSISSGTVCPRTNMQTVRTDCKYNLE